MKLVQLTLFADHEGHVDYQCVHCGWHQDPLPALRAQGDGLDQFMKSARVRIVPRATRRFLEEALPVLVERPVIGVGMMALARETGYSKSATYRHLKALITFGVLQPVAKREGSRYHRYRLAPHADLAPVSKSGTKSGKNLTPVAV